MTPGEDPFLRNMRSIQIAGLYLTGAMVALLLALLAFTASHPPAPTSTCRTPAPSPAGAR